MRGQLTSGTVLRTYEAALNDPDADSRLARLRSVASDGLVVLPGYDPAAAAIEGLEAFSDAIGTLLERTRPPGYRLELHGGVDAHHGWVRFHWRVVGPGGEAFRDGERTIAGVDVARVAADGRLETIVAFLGDAPPADPDVRELP